MTSTNHAMPRGIRRVEKGVYRTLDDAYEIRQDGKSWGLFKVDGDKAMGEFGSRNAAVEALASDGLLPKLEEKPEPEQAPRPTEKAPKRSKEAKAS